MIETVVVWYLRAVVAALACWLACWLFSVLLTFVEG